MGGVSESVCRPGIKYKSFPGGLRRPQVAPDSLGLRPDLDQTKPVFWTDKVPGHPRQPQVASGHLGLNTD